MFECSYKFTEEDNVAGTLATMRQQSNVTIKILQWVSPVLLLLNIALLAWDIYDKESILLDIVLIVVTISCMLLVYNLKGLYRYSARVTYRKALSDKDSFTAYMDENNCKASFSKGGQEVARELLDWNDLTDYEEDEERLVLIFGVKFVVLRKSVFRGELDLLKMLLNKYAKNKQTVV